MVTSVWFDGGGGGGGDGINLPLVEDDHLTGDWKLWSGWVVVFSEQ